jgi:pterin-4a-carbinolamine dehydratase
VRSYLFPSARTAVGFAGVVCDISETFDRVPVVEIEGRALRVKITGGEAGLDDYAFNLADRIAQTE